MSGIPKKLNRFKTLLLKNPERTPTDIAMEVYDCKSRLTACVIGSQNLRKLNIELAELFERAGLTDEHDVDFLKDTISGANKVISCNVIADSGEGMKDANSMTKDFVDVPDHNARIKAFELLQKLKGRLRDKSTVEINQNTQYVQIYRPERYSREETMDMSREALTND